VEELTKVMKEIEKTLKSSFDSEEEEMMDYFDELQDKIFHFTQDFLKKSFRDINTNLMRRFNIMFANGQDGKPRDWRLMEEAKIKEEYFKAKQCTEDIFPELKYIKLPQ
jgi:hypothetical protein